MASKAPETVAVSNIQPTEPHSGSECELWSEAPYFRKLQTNKPTDRQTYEINSPADNQQQTASQIFQRISGNCAKNQQKNYQKGLMCIFGNVLREFQTNINEN